uniref:Uncharacterized protein n=1 Tax=Rhizophora mucronata TaxID=61149 RepID=A0A2P2NT92_RHIMU
MVSSGLLVVLHFVLINCLGATYLPLSF